MESVEAISPVEGFKALERAGTRNDAEGLLRQIMHGSDCGRRQQRETAAECPVNEGKVKQVQGHKESHVSRKLLPQEALEVITAEHRRLWDKVRKKLVAGLCKRDLNKGLEQLKVAKLAGDILSVVVKGQRQAWGLDALEGELRCDDTEEFIEEMASLTVPSRADKVMD